MIFGAAGDDAADHRVRLDAAPPLGGQLQGPPHVPEIEFGRVHTKVKSQKSKGRRHGIVAVCRP